MNIEELKKVELEFEGMADGLASFYGEHKGKMIYVEFSNFDRFCFNKVENLESILLENDYVFTSYDGQFIEELSK